MAKEDKTESMEINVMHLLEFRKQLQCGTLPDEMLRDERDNLASIRMICYKRCTVPGSVQEKNEVKNDVV